MAGIYIHIPFCRKACHYCNFHFSTNTRNTDDFLTALRQEIQLQKNYLNGRPVETVYYGGGTPSLLPAAELTALNELIRDVFEVTPGAEYTLETNPDDITPAALAAWKAAGFNRLSIGIQSFFEGHLQWMNRAHNAVQARQSVQWAHEAGFHSLTIDLIYGVPGLSAAQWTANIETAAQLDIQHLSCYALTVEPGTALEKMIGMQKKEAVDPEAAALHFEILMERAAALGFEHYEISNFAKPGYRSRHNSAYWQGTHYLGLGPSAHSFNGVSRQWNVSNNGIYIQSLQGGSLPFEMETLNPVQQLNEYIMTALRTLEGLNLDKVERDWGANQAERLRRAATAFIENGRMQLTGGHLCLTRAGKLFADGIAAALFG